MREGIVVLLAEKNHIGPGQLSQHLVVVGGLAGGGVEAVGRPVAAQGEAGEQENKKSEGEEAHRKTGCKHYKRMPYYKAAMAPLIYYFFKGITGISKTI